MKKNKKYQLVNSYFKVAERSGLPVNILDIAKWNSASNDLPFAYKGNNWVYDAFCEKQKRSGVTNSQFLTPDATVDRMLHFAGMYFNDNHVLEPGCGTGQITKELLNDKAPCPFSKFNTTKSSKCCAPGICITSF